MLEQSSVLSVTEGTTSCLCHPRLAGGCCGRQSPGCEVRQREYSAQFTASLELFYKDTKLFSLLVGGGFESIGC